MKNLTIKYLKKSVFECSADKKMITGEGYLFNGKPLCLKHYQQKFPKFLQEEKE